MIVFFNLIALVIVLGALALITAVGSALISRAHPPKGRFVPVNGGRLHIDELGEPRQDETAVVLVHGASGNMEDMRLALGNVVSKHYRTILIDRPGRGWSEREPGRDLASPQRQADMVAEALGKLGVKHAIIVGHSWGGAFATALAIRHPDLTAGLVQLAPTSHPWHGGVSWYYTLVTTPLIGPLFAHTLVLPLGALLAANATASVFEPQTPPQSYIGRSATWLVLRPKAFEANARDMTELKGNLEKLVPLYPSITAPTVILVGARDLTVANDVHAQELVKAIPNARLEILQGVGHMPHHARPDRVVAAIEDVLGRSGGQPARATPLGSRGVTILNRATD
jgi:pimeloyl-ACP methyl ester carboxylesterase